jgi:hypothetical protein
MQIKDLDYHRNGVSGQPFNVGIIKDEDGSDKLVIQFQDKICTAVLDMELLKKDNISFMQNSWRGDSYADEFNKLAKQFFEEKAKESLK